MYLIRGFFLEKLDIVHRHENSRTLHMLIAQSHFTETGISISSCCLIISNSATSLVYRLLNLFSDLFFGGALNNSYKRIS